MRTERLPGNHTRPEDNVSAWIYRIVKVRQNRPLRLRQIQTTEQMIKRSREGSDFQLLFGLIKECRVDDNPAAVLIDDDLVFPANFNLGLGWQ